MSTSGLFWNRKVSNPISLWQNTLSLVAHADFPSTLLPKWQKHLPHKLHLQPHHPVETTSYGKAWRAFRKENFGLCSTTYYLTMPITCTQTWIHRTQLLHYGKSLMRSSLWHIVTTNFAYRDISWYIVLLCKISLQQSLARPISRRDISKIVLISRWFIILTFGNPCDVLLIYRR